MKRLIKLEKTNCTPCQVVGNFLESEYPELDVLVVNVEDNPEIASKYEISSVPAVAIIDGEGNLLTDFVYQAQLNKIEILIQSHLI